MTNLHGCLDQVLNPPPGHHLQDIELLNPYNPKEALDDKVSILDIKARDQSGRQFNVEMQMLAYRHHEKRILLLRPTISINFLDHVLFRNTPRITCVSDCWKNNITLPLTDDIEFHIIELPKFTKPVTALITGLDVWLYFLRHAATMDMAALPAEFTQHPLVLRGLEELKMLAHTDEERERYESRRKAQLDYNTGLKVARMEGKEVGIAKGVQIGITTGREGLEKGRAIGVIHLCEQLLQRPLTPEEQLANLSLEQWNRLADELQNQLRKK